MPSVTAPFDSLLLPLLFSVVVISAPQCYLPNGEATNSISLAGMQGLSRPACAATSRTIVTTTQSALLTLLKTANLISIAGPAFSKEDWSNPACPQFCVVPSHNDDGVEPMDRCGFEQDGFWDCSSGCFELPGNLDVYGIAYTGPKLRSTAANSTEGSETTTKGSTESRCTPSTTNFAHLHPILAELTCPRNSNGFLIQRHLNTTAFCVASRRGVYRVGRDNTAARHGGRILSNNRAI